MNTRRAVVLAGGLALLGGCGFKLRQPPKLAFETIRSPGNFATPVARELMRALEQAGVRVLPPEPPRQPAQGEGGGRVGAQRGVTRAAASGSGRGPQRARRLQPGQLRLGHPGRGAHQGQALRGGGFV